MNAKPGDKVRVKTSKSRGKVAEINGKQIVVSLDGGGKATVEARDLTNYSLAARKAWESMPDRRVGRPKGTSKTNRVSVTLRIDRELWERFKRAEKLGQVKDRTETVNQWIAEKLDELTN